MPGVPCAPGLNPGGAGLAGVSGAHGGHRGLVAGSPCRCGALRVACLLCRPPTLPLV